MQTRKTPYLRLTTLFFSIPRAPLSIRVLDYNPIVIVGELFARCKPVTVQLITLPDEMFPLLESGEQPDILSDLHLPRMLRPGESFRVALRVPAMRRDQWAFTRSDPPEEIHVTADGDGFQRSSTLS